MTVSVGSRLGNYTIVRALGSGGMADVFEARDEMLERIVALKVLPIEYSRNPQLVARFQKEVRAAAKLNHRNIVTVFEVGQQDNYHFFSMRLLTGGDLRKRIQQGLSPVEALAILRELADAFAHAHARGFVHRDVKPENVMFDEQGFPVLTDFGIAKALDANTHMTRTGMTMGTPRYLSPEQASGKPVDARADLYSLGVMFHEMLTGRPPYDAEEAMAVIFKHVTEPIPTLPADCLRYQPLLEKLMAKDPNQRIASGVELIQAIDALTRTATSEVRQSQLRTAANPLVQGLLTPSPLRTPTPAPMTPRPQAMPQGDAPPGDSGEIAVRTRTAHPVTAAPSRAASAAPVTAAAASRPAAAEPADATPARSRGPLIAGVLAAGIAAVAAGAWLVGRAPAPVPRSAPVPAAADPAAQARGQAETRRLEQARQARLREQDEARQAQEAAAAEQRRREDQARADAVARPNSPATPADAPRQASAPPSADAEAAARRRADAEAAARRQREQDAAARRAEQQRQAQADERRKAQEAAAAVVSTPHSPQTTTRVRLTLVNNCALPIVAVWVDHQGKSQDKGLLKPERRQAFASYASHLWRIYEQPRRGQRTLVREHTLGQADELLDICEPRPAGEEDVAKERTRRPTGF